jgi:transposase, IS30 family
VGTQTKLMSVQRRYWELVAQGVTPLAAGPMVGVSETCGGTWFRNRGGVNPQFREHQGQIRPRLSIAEREEIMIGTAQRESIRSIARRLGRAPSTIMREIHCNGRCREAPGRYRAWYRFGARRAGWDARSGYRASLAQVRSEARVYRPRGGKLARCEELRQVVEGLLVKKYSPQQVTGLLAMTYPDRPEMQVSHETIYRALYVQGRGELRRELTRCLRTGRAVRKPHRSPTERRGRMTGMVNISQRPAEVADRAVPGHWEGDLIIGKDQSSQIGTLVERSTGFVQLLHLPENRTADVVAEAMTATIKAFPAMLWKTLTWDQGHEMAAHARISIDAGIDIYFCDPHSPWQRGSNENTNGLLRQYFPKGTDLSKHSASYLEEVAAELNNRPRKRYGFHSPTQVLNRLLSNPTETTVATNP